MKKMKTKSRHMYLMSYLRKQVIVSCNVNIANVQFKDLKKEIRWFWKTELNVRNKKEKEEPEDKVLVLNSR